MDKDKINNLVLNNMNLVHNVVNGFNITENTENMDYDDMFQIGCIGLLNAIKLYDEKKGNLTSYAYVSIRNEIIRYLNKNKIKYDILYLDQKISNTTKDEEYSIKDILERTIKNKYYDEYIDNFLIFDYFDRFIDEICTEYERKILFMRLNNMNYTQISKKLNLSRDTVRRKLARIKRRYERYKIVTRVKK